MTKKRRRTLFLSYDRLGKTPAGVISAAGRGFAQAAKFFYKKTLFLSQSANSRLATDCTQKPANGGRTNGEQLTIS